MEKRYYNAATLERSLRVFEERYALDSATCFAMRQSGDEAGVEHIPRFHQHVWASFYRKWKRLSGEDFVQHVERELEPA
jgi:hypothetical protein